MDAPFKNNLNLDQLAPEVKSYIYQVIAELEPYTTPNTLIAVLAKDPLKLVPDLEENGETVNQNELKQMFRISISLSEDGAKIEEEALAADLIEAIKLAKDKLLAALKEIQDDAISNKDRAAEIINMLQQTGTIH